MTDSTNRWRRLLTRLPGGRTLHAGALLASLALALTACGGASSGGGSGFLACEVTDTGGIDDRSFNASAWQGLQQARDKSGIQIQNLQSTNNSDYAPNIQQFEQRKCGLIVTVGFLMGDATQAAAKSSPKQKFAIVDFSYPQPMSNVLALLYKTDQDAFQGGYLAAAMSKSGKVGTFGGQQIPTVTIYMDGFVAGVRYYDKKNNAHVQALGWDPEHQTGSFTNDFTNQAKGKEVTDTLLGQGADVIFPVAGNVGLGAAASVQQHNQGSSSPASMLWVDTDGCVSAPQYCSLFITSVTKGIAPSVEQAAVTAKGGSFNGGNYYGTLKNGGVGLAPFHDFDGKVPPSVKTALDQIKSQIIAGSLSTDPKSYPAA
jgi:basic membrane protein A and related proteins